MLTTIIAFIIALGIIITFHEYGHYWAAKRCGVKVLRFSVGFGKPLLKRLDRSGTEWVLAGIPLGGYVKMQDDPEPDATPDQARQAFANQPVRNRFFIVSAGPIANFILAAVIYAVLSMMGSEEPVAVLGQPTANSAAAESGLQAGDRVLAVNGTPVQSWNQMRWQMLDDMVKGGTVELTVDRLGSTLTKSVRLPGAGSDPEADTLGLAGVRLQPGKTVVTSIVPDSPAQAAGLQSGDVILSVDGQSVSDTRALINTVQANPNQPLQMSVQRQDVPITVTITPGQVEGEQGAPIGRIGTGLANEVPTVMIEHGVMQSMWQGVSRTAETAWFSLKMLGSMVTGAVSWKNISGPVTIADYAGQTASLGLTAYLAFLALVSVSIGVLNLLPIPMLDGGHLLFYVVEMVRGKPAPARWMEAGQRLGLFMLAGLMTLAVFNDITRLLS